MHVVEEGSIGDEFIDEKRHLCFQAAAQQPNHVPVIDLRKNDHFINKLLDLSLIHQLRFLDRNFPTIRQSSFINCTIPAMPQYAVVTEVVSCRFKLAGGEDLGGDLSDR
ncbi:hypothetical protein IEQ34_021998 [Dendrobium chrysotoxum]|uniref:Uncharacterized protein n=1 Tax=Dendrobium chrysotoxum TaxID=161865 RepID=A0AAV7FXJ8_DENCH|nr:hypothetical protein IEQ34_021998 [Dendrobium chrysotoxum]